MLTRMDLSSEQTSLRLGPEVAEALAQRAKELGGQVAPLAERYVAEGLRMDRYPGIVFRDGAAGRRAALAGHRLDVWQVVETVRNSNGDEAEAAAYLGVTADQVHAAVVYAAAFKDEIEGWIARNAVASDQAETAWRQQRAAAR